MALGTRLHGRIKLLHEAVIYGMQTAKCKNINQSIMSVCVQYRIRRIYFYSLDRKAGSQLCSSYTLTTVQLTWHRLWSVLVAARDNKMLLTREMSLIHPPILPQRILVETCIQTGMLRLPDLLIQPFCTNTFVSYLSILHVIFS